MPHHLENSAGEARVGTAVRRLRPRHQGDDQDDRIEIKSIG